MENTWYVLESAPVMTVREFCERNGLRMKVKEQATPRTPDGAYIARIEGAEVMERGCLVSTWAGGKTPDEAIAAYAREISSKRIALGAYTEGRREIDVPRLVHEP